MSKKFTKLTAPTLSKWYGQMTAAARDIVEFENGSSIVQSFRLCQNGQVIMNGLAFYSDSGRVEDNRRVLVGQRGGTARIDNGLFQTLQALLS